jgi:purine catabolism regulator
MGMKLSQLIELPVLHDTEVLAGAPGLDREVRRVTVLESPDIGDWLTGGELVLSNTFLFQAQPGTDAALVRGLVEGGATALGIKLGRYVSSLSKEALRIADEAGMPVLRLPYEVPWADVINAVLTELLDEKTALLERSENIHTQFTRCVLQGRGLDGIAATLNELTGMAVIITDSDLEIMASAGSEESVAALTQNADFLLESARADQTIDQLSGVSENSIKRATLDSRHYLVVPVRVSGRREGYLLLGERAGRPLARLDLVAVQHARTVASIEFSTKRSVREVERRFGSDFVLDLLTGHFESVEAMKRRASHFNLNLDLPQALLIVEVDDLGAAEGAEPSDAGSPAAIRDSLLGAVQQSLRKAGFVSASIPLGKSVIVFLPVRGKKTATEVKRLTERVGRALIEDIQATHPGAIVSVGIGRFQSSITHLPDAYRQAREALEIGRSVWGRGRVVHFNDLGLFRLLARTNGEAVDFVNDTLGKLLDHDRRYGSQLVLTLEAFLAANGNISQAARELVVHVNTLKYRLGKIEEISQLDLSDPEVRLNAQIALRLARAYPSLTEMPNPADA